MPLKYIMPNGDEVEFPEGTSPEQAKAQILKWFPDAAKTAKGPAKIATEKPAEALKPGESTLQWGARQAADFGKGVGQSLGRTAAGLSEILPGGNLPGLPEQSTPRSGQAAGGMTPLTPNLERAVEARAQAMKEVKEFTDAPSGGLAQTAGQVAGEVAPYFIGPSGVAAKIGEEAIQAGATKLLPRVAPAIRQASGRMAANPAYAARQALLTKLGGVGSTLGDVVERTAMGATIGAAQDPEDRLRGAIAGGVGAGVLPFGLGAISKPLSGFAGHLARTAAGTGAGWFLQQEGVNPYEAYALGLGGAYSPLGKIARATGAWPVRATLAAGSKFPQLTAAATTGAARSFGESHEQQP
jgi:hypothetical protein